MGLICHHFGEDVLVFLIPLTWIHFNKLLKERNISYIGLSATTTEHVQTLWRHALRVLGEVFVSWKGHEELFEGHGRHGIWHCVSRVYVWWGRPSTAPLASCVILMFLTPAVPLNRCTHGGPVPLLSLYKTKSQLQIADHRLMALRRWSFWGSANSTVRVFNATHLRFTLNLHASNSMLCDGVMYWCSSGFLCAAAELTKTDQGKPYLYLPQDWSNIIQQRVWLESHLFAFIPDQLEDKLGMLAAVSDHQWQ